MNCPKGKKRTETSIKNDWIKLKDKVGMAVLKKYMNKICRDNLSHPLYIPTLAL